MYKNYIQLAQNDFVLKERDSLNASYDNHLVD